MTIAVLTFVTLITIYNFVRVCQLETRLEAVEIKRKKNKARLLKLPVEQNARTRR